MVIRRMNFEFTPELAPIQENGSGFRNRHQIKLDHLEYKRELEEAGLSDETSDESPLSSLTASED
jgi:hypothetical protein